MKNTQRNELAVCGFAAVKTLEKMNSQKIQRFYFTEERAPFFGGLCKKMAASKRPYNKVSDSAELEKLCGSVHHQGVVAMIEAPRVLPLNTDITARWVEQNESAIILDRVGNANNLGAIVRSAAFFGIRNIVIPLDESQSSVTTSSYRVAEGGMEFVNIYSVRSIPFLLKDMKGKMARFGTSLKGTTDVSQMKSLCAGKPALVVLGNEEKGISDEVAQNCDSLVIIPFAGMGDSGPRVDSLNVAQAASVVMYELRK
ncbi:TrmH family RNA methyltransferase [Treponema sp.]|uniref:TrmH family RNA methyltransferase n=1 Tax=Treponema sp. TaxID=166 RepID=UPI003F077DD9